VHDEDRAWRGRARGGGSIKEVHPRYWLPPHVLEMELLAMAYPSRRRTWSSTAMTSIGRLRWSSCRRQPPSRRRTRASVVVASLFLLRRSFSRRKLVSTAPSLPWRRTRTDERGGGGLPLPLEAEEAGERGAVVHPFEADGNGQAQMGQVIAKKKVNN
jgi:hypothetical protein